MKNNIAIDAPASTRPEIYFPAQMLKQQPSTKSFFTYIYVENKIYSLLMLAIIILQFIIFKFLYPFPDFFSDSYSYIEAAILRYDVNIWPIGYSKFLMVFHWFTHSATLLNLFQYLFLELSALYFYHTLVYFYPTGKYTRIILCLFLFFNPLNLYLANYVSSDAIFIALSLIWITQLIWIIHRPRRYHTLVLTLVFLIAFTFRYNAMFYPLIAAAVIILSRQKLYMKLAGIAAGPLLIIPFVIFSSNAAKKMTGTAQFPPILGGWQWGNNALYMRGFIEEDSTKFPTPETRDLDRIARTYFNQPSRPQDQLAGYVANFFIRQPEAPLKQYMLYRYGEFNDGLVEHWGKVAPVFEQYGLFLIKRHPLAFARYYLLVNTKNYFFPPLEKLEVYNVGSNMMRPVGAYWFGLGFRDLKMKVVSIDLQGYVLMVYPALFAILNLYFTVALIQYIRRKLWKTVPRLLNISIMVVTAFLLLNFAFSVFANIIVIRYQVYPMIILLTFTMLLTDQLETDILLRRSKEKDNVGPLSHGLSPSMQPKIS